MQQNFYKINILYFPRLSEWSSISELVAVRIFKLEAKASYGGHKDMIVDIYRIIYTYIYVYIYVCI